MSVVATPASATQDHSDNRPSANAVASPPVHDLKGAASIIARQKHDEAADLAARPSNWLVSSLHTLFNKVEPCIGSPFKIKIPASKRPKFSAGKALKDAVNR